MKKTREENDTDLLLFGGRAVRLPLAEAMRVMLVFTYGALKEFPRYEKNGLASEIRTVTWQIHKQILSARRFQRFMKTPSSIKAQCDRLERLCEIDLSDINPSIQSWLGHASHANSYGLRKSLLDKPFRRSTQ